MNGELGGLRAKEMQPVETSYPSYFLLLAVFMSPSLLPPTVTNPQPKPTSSLLILASLPYASYSRTDPRSLHGLRRLSVPFTFSSPHHPYG